MELQTPLKVRTYGEDSWRDVLDAGGIFLFEIEDDNADRIARDIVRACNNFEALRRIAYKLTTTAHGIYDEQDVLVDSQTFITLKNYAREILANAEKEA